MRALKPPISPVGRDLDLERLTSEKWDLLVVGAGVTGLAVARDAALRGAKVAVIEEYDIAFGTSSRSSRLIHGGLRYLASFELGLVREGLVERQRLLRTSGGLVRPERFLYLVYCEDPDSLFKIRLGVGLYGLLSTGYRLGPSHRVSKAQLVETLPGIETDCLDGAVSYYDGATHDARLTVALACSCREVDVPVITRCRALNFLSEDSRTVGATVVDSVSSQTHKIRSRAVVVCTGPWQGLHRDIPPKIRTARGSHVSVPRERLPISCFLAMRSPDDGRQTFALPFGDYTVLGTTDVDDATPPAEVRPTVEDTDYLLAVANQVFPDADLGRGDVVGSWAGLRPLVADETATDPDALSRKHRVVRASPGCWILAGGKLTSHRKMAEDCVNRVLRGEPFRERSFGPCVTQRRDLCQGNPDRGRLILTRLKVPADKIDYLEGLYGARLDRLTDHLENAPAVEFDERILRAQATLAAEEEGALSLDDILLRRVDPGLLDLVRCWHQAPLVAREVAEPLGWSREHMESQVEAFRRGIEEELRATRGDIPIQA